MLLAGTAFPPEPPTGWLRTADCPRGNSCPVIVGPCSSNQRSTSLIAALWSSGQQHPLA
jgi:hypothetical protein